MRTHLDHLMLVPFLLGKADQPEWKEDTEWRTEFQLLTPAEGRPFGLQVGLAFAALGGLAWWRGHFRLAAVLLVVGGVLVAGGLLAPGGLGPVYRAWMRLALALSKFTTPLILGILYLLVLMPTGLLLRLFRHRTLGPRAERHELLDAPLRTRWRLQ